MAVTFNTNWLGGIIGGGLGALSGYQKMSYINDMYENMWEAAAEKYKATEDAINITKVAAESQMRDVIGELQRVGASYQKEVEKEGQKAMSQQRASREGLTGGNTAVRQDIATQIKINQVAAETQEKTQSMINQVVDAKDSKMNQLNTQLLQAWTEAQGILSRKAPTEYRGQFSVICLAVYSRDLDRDGSFRVELKKQFAPLKSQLSMLCLVLTRQLDLSLHPENLL